MSALKSAVAVQDNISTLGVETNCGAKMLKGYVPVFNATVIDKLNQAGVTIKGKFGTGEFGLSEAKEAANAGDITLAIGTGAILSSCKIWIKPTYGSVSRYGLISCTPSMDQIGPLGSDIDECADLLSIISGYDPKDSTSIMEKPFEFSKEAGVNGILIGLPSNLIRESLLPVKDFTNAGANAEKFEMPLTEYIVPAYDIIACAEASSNLARLDGFKYGYRAEASTWYDIYKLSRSEGFGTDAKRTIMLGSLVLSTGLYDTYYRKALQTRTLVINAYKSLFEKYDMILANGDIFKASLQLAGLPAITLAPGFTLAGPAFSEEKLIKAARVYLGGASS